VVVCKLALRVASRAAGNCKPFNKRRLDHSLLWPQDAPKAIEARISLAQLDPDRLTNSRAQETYDSSGGQRGPGAEKPPSDE
jgi:hypothetical protein